MSGVVLPHGCRITHGSGAALKSPFADMPLTMHELSAGGIATFAGPYGFIPFTAAIRLPRHVHLGVPAAEGTRALLAERILVLNGCGLVELAGALHVVAPGSLVEIGPGVPHSWTACPAGVRLPDGTSADGTFLMVYEYEAPTGFLPCCVDRAVGRCRRLSGVRGRLRGDPHPGARRRPGGGPCDADLERAGAPTGGVVRRSL